VWGGLTESERAVLYDKQPRRAAAAAR
jgi:hypothetical protein